MPPAITSEVVVAYAQCPRKAYFLLFGQDKGEPHAYVQILAQQQQENHARYLDRLRQKHTAMQSYSLENLRDGSAMLINARLQGDGLEAECGILTRGEGQSTSGPPCYEPTICVGTYNISEDQKRELVFVGYVLAHVQRQSPVAGSIIGMDGTAHTVQLGRSATGLLPLLAPLRAWTTTASPEPPPIILNKHCPLCPFQRVSSPSRTGGQPQFAR